MSRFKLFRHLTMLSALICFVVNGWGQVSSYSFTQSNGSYSAISGGTAHNTTQGDNQNYSFNLPFTFTYNGTGYTVARPTTNGFLVLGGNAPSSSQYTPLSSGTTNFAISAFGHDLRSIVRSEVIGTSPNRIYVCQWSSVQRWASSTWQTDACNFQIRLYETTNVIEVVYGSNSGASFSSSVQVGLRGSASTDFNSRTSTSSWSSTSNSTSNSATLTYSSSVKPSSGLTFTWTPPQPCTAPTSLASNISSSTQTSTTITGSFNAAASAPGGYLVIRTSTNSQPTPVNGTTYTTGSNAIGFIEYVGSSVGSWTSSGLTPSTTYYYWVFSYNNTNCTGGPVYSTSTTNFSQSTSSCTGAALANLSYTASTASYCLSAAITSNTATLGTTSGVPTYTISPALPTGLILSSSTGAITGTPTAAVATTNYTVTADNGCTNTTASLSLTTNALPATPTASAATSAGTYGFTANWTSSAGATAYFLDVSTSSSFTSMLSGYDGLNVGTVTTSAVTGLGSGTTYYYRVRSTNGTCNSLNSSTITIATTALTSLATGDWNSGTTWSGGQVPTCNDNVTIQSTHNVTVNSLSNVSKNLTIASGGTLTVASGDLTVGCTLNNTPLTNNGTLTVTGGTLNVNGNITSASGSTFNQSAGDINVDGNNGGSTTGSVASGTPLLNFAQVVAGINLTGGNLTIVDPHTATTNTNAYALYYSNSATAATTVNNSHVIRFGNGTSTDAGGNLNGFYVNNWNSNSIFNMGSVEVNGPSVINRQVTSVYQLIVAGNVTVNSGGILNLAYLEIGGHLTVNSGGTFINGGINTLYYINTVTRNAAGSIVASSNAQTIGGTGSYINASTSNTASLNSLTINNTSSGGVTISTPLSISGTLTMTAGKINTTATNLITLGTTSAAGTLSYAAGQIAGPFARTFAASSNTSSQYNATTLFPIGDGTNYSPIHLDPVTNASGPMVFSAQVFGSNSGSAGVGVSTALASKRWEALVLSGSSNMDSCFVGLNDAGIIDGNIIAQSTSANGTYNTINASSNFSTGTPNRVRTSKAITNPNYSGYFTYAAPGPAITSFTPTNACPNAATTITITGTNLGSATSVTLNGEACTINTVTNTATSLTFTTDATPQAGNIVVTTAANSATSATAVSLFTLPTVTATSDASNNTICSGTSITLNGGGASTYTWDNSVTNNTAFAPTSSTTYTVTGTDVNGCTNTASIAVTVNQIVAIATQPSSQVVLPNDNVIFSVSATGTGLAYQWQENTGSGWNTITDGGIYSGATTSALSLTGVTSANTGNQYQCIVSGTAPCSAQTSNSATLTISTTAISAHPVNQTICVTAGTATFSITTTGTTPSYQWQVSTNSGSTWADITNETSSSLSLSGLTLTENGNLYRCLLNSGSITSNSASLSINAASVAGTTSADQGICSNASATNITLTGNTGTIQWQVSSDNSSFADIATATSSPLTASQIGSLSATRYYRAVVTNGVCSATNSSVVTITVTTAPNAGTLSGTQGVCVGATTTFSSNGDTGGAWSSANTATASINSSTGVISGDAAGTTTMTYTVTGTGGCADGTSTRTVTVNANPAITSATASPATLCAGSSVSLSAASVSVSSGNASVGSGALTGSSVAQSIFPGGWGGAKTQYLIRASELTNAGLVSGNISSIAFEPTTSGQTYQGFFVYISSTSLTALSSTFETMGTQVYAGTLTNNGFTPTANVVNTLTFGTGAGSTSSFNWDGNSNIIVTFSWSRVPSASTSTSSVMKYDVTSFNCTNYKQADSQTPAQLLAQTTGATSSSRPKLIFGGQVGTNNAASFSWSWNTTPTVSTATGTTTAVNNTSSSINQDYTVTATNATTGCTNSATTSSITINPVPTSPSANSTSICGPQNATCSVTGSGTVGNTFKWYTVSTGGTAISGQTAATLSAYPISTTTTLYASEANANCESARVDVIQTVTTPPSLTASASNATVCTGASTTLSATSVNTGYTYTWNNSGGSGASVTVSPSATTTYTVTATDASGGASNGCSTTATTSITVNPLPTTPTITPSTATLCIGVSPAQSLVLSGGSEVVYENGFESGVTGFTPSANATATSNTSFYSGGTKSVLFNTSTTSATQSLTMDNNIDLTNASNVQITFTHIAAMEGATTSYDYGLIQYSSDGGTTWSTFLPADYVGSASTTPFNTNVRFTTRSYSDWISGLTSTSSLPTNSLWKTEKLNVPTAALTSQFKIRFRYSTDSGTFYYGWLIDDVLITKASAITWTPTTALFTNLAATTPYTGSSATTVYAQPTTTTIYTATATSSSGCISSNTSTITVSPTSVAGSVSAASSTFCAGTGTSLTLTGNTGSIQWQNSIDNVTFANMSGETASTLSTGNLAQTTYYKAVVTSGACTAANTSTETITVSPTTVAGTISAASSSVCTGTGTTLTLSGNTGTIQWQNSSDNVTFTNMSGETASSLSTGNLTQTSYYKAVVTSGVCTAANTSTQTITVNQPTLTWTGATSTDPTVTTNWNPAALPCPVADITVPGGLTNYPIYTSNLTISSGGSYTLQAGAQLTVNGTLTNNGTFTLQDGATFVQGTGSTSIAGTGTYNVEKALTDNSSNWSTTSGRFWYMGVPMVNVARSSYGAPDVNANRLWSYTESSKSYTELSDGTALLSAGTGYVHRRSTDGTLTFTATGTNGLYGSDFTATNLTKTAGYTSGVHLVSNPYMAYLDWDAVYNASTNIDPTFYIRSYNANNNDINALISYNGSTSQLVSNASSVNITNASQIRYIAPMQSIWVKVGASASTGTVNMTRNMLSHQTGNGLKSSTVFPTLARVNLVDGNQFDQLLVYMNGDMSNEVDQYDSEKLPVSGTVQVYTMASNKKLVMNGLKNNKKKVSVPLYLELPAAKSYTLNLADYVLDNGLILLEDKLEGTMQDFTLLGSYTFYANSGLLQNRFVLHFILPDAEFTNQGPSNSWVGPETSYTEGGNVQITNDDRGNIQITVDQPEDQKVEGNVSVTDMNGKEIYKGQLDGITTAVELNVPAGIYYLTVQSGVLFEKKKVFIQD